jgi:hypothetical protein
LAFNRAFVRGRRAPAQRDPVHAQALSRLDCRAAQPRPQDGRE